MVTVTGRGDNPTNQCDSVRYAVSSFISTAPRDSFPSFVGTKQYQNVSKTVHSWDAQGVINMSCNNIYIYI